MTTKRTTKKPAAKAAGDIGEEAFRIMAVLNGFDIVEFDAWLARLGECGALRELTQRRELAKAATLANNEDGALRHLEWMQRRQHEIVKSDSIAPIVKRDAARQAGTRKPRNVASPAWHDEAVRHARTLLATGTEAHEITAKCARRFGKSNDAVRSVLNSAGLVTRRKTRA